MVCFNTWRNITLLMGNVTVMLINAAPQPHANSFHLKPRTGNFVNFVELPWFPVAAIFLSNYQAFGLLYLTHYQRFLYLLDLIN